MKQYKEYKDSGIAWIGAIPSHWQVKRLKQEATCNDDTLNETTPPEQIINYVEISDVNEVDGITRYTEYEFGLAPSRARRVTKINDIIISTVRTYLKAVARIKQPNLIVSTGFAVLRARNINSTFLSYLVQSSGFIDEVIANSQGVNYPAITANRLMSLSLPLPPKAEQEAIVKYLDKKTEQINQYIRLQEQQIQGLQELKQSIIARAVTRGLDPKAPLRPSGIAWIGDIPFHWQVKRLGSLAKVRTGTTPTSTDLSYYDGDILWFTPSDFSKDGITLSSSKRTLSLQAITENKITLFPANSVLMIGIGATLGRIGITNTPSYSNQQINAIIPGNRIIAQYTAYWLLSNKSSIWVSANSATLPILNQEKTKNLPILLPPVEEQEAIVKYLDEKTEQINLLISKTEASIALMKEFKQSLIADAVTGRINVQPA